MDFCLHEKFMSMYHLAFLNLQEFEFEFTKLNALYMIVFIVNSSVKFSQLNDLSTECHKSENCPSEPRCI